MWPGCCTIRPFLSYYCHSVSRRMSSGCIAAVGQLSRVSHDKVANTQQCLYLAQQAYRMGAQMLFLPEASDFIAESSEQAVEWTDPLHENNLLQQLSQAARDYNLYVSVGLHEPVPHDSTKLYNSHVIIDSKGDSVGHYKKIHLFDVDIQNGPRLLESKTTLAGNQVVAPVETPVGRVGLSVCYDVRFPEMGIALRQKGAHLLTYPSAFTVPTGTAHWFPLLQARAIENQCYVIASAHIGKHGTKRESFGRACIVDPWGTVIAQCPVQTDQPTLATAVIDLDFITSIRTQMPVFQHRRSDIYSQ